ncbi:hypothetical protein CROQUDRAFT_106185, partial [Cronartium quercuum f. sp. fusiforme G11]
MDVAGHRRLSLPNSACRTRGMYIPRGSDSVSQPQMRHDIASGVTPSHSLFYLFIDNQLTIRALTQDLRATPGLHLRRETHAALHSLLNKATSTKQVSS